jgi:hypothetical protein
MQQCAIHGLCDSMGGTTRGPPHTQRMRTAYAVHKVCIVHAVYAARTGPLRTSSTLDARPGAQCMILNRILNHLLKAM